MSALTAQLERIGSELPTSSSSPTGPNIARLVDRARNELMRISGPDPIEGRKLEAWKGEMRELLGRIDDHLRELRRETSLGPQPS